MKKSNESLGASVVMPSRNFDASHFAHKDWPQYLTDTSFKKGAGDTYGKRSHSWNIPMLGKGKTCSNGAVAIGMLVYQSVVGWDIPSHPYISPKNMQRTQKNMKMTLLRDVFT